MTFDVRAVAFTIGPWLAVAAVAMFLVWWWAGPRTVRNRHRILWVFRGCMLVALAVIGSNPVHVDVAPGAVRRPEVHILLDASQSMLLGSPETRWEEGTTLLRTALAATKEHADVRIHRFGQRLVPLDVQAFVAGGSLARPDDADTQLATAFRQLASRLGRDPPAAVVVVSDGRVRDPETVDEMAAPWKRLHVPVHVVPLGQADPGGDVAIIAAIAPAKARMQSQVDVNVFLRSFGFAGERVDLQLQSLDENGAVRRIIRTMPVSLQDGVQTLTVTFRTEPDQKRLRLHIPLSPRDLAPANNDFPFEIDVDRSKIRVLLVEGADDGGQFQFDDVEGGYPFRNALLADPDIQCAVFRAIPGFPTPQRVALRESGAQYAFPQSVAALLAYDVIVLSNVPRSSLSDEVIEWLEEWIGKRGGGLVMAGGPQSFGAGGWAGSAVERMLPVEFLGGPDWEATPVTLEPEGTELHPVWRLFEDERATRAAIRTLPPGSGRNNWVRVKPQSGTLLGIQKASAEANSTVPLLAVANYGRGRTMALATPLSGSLAPQFARQWGEGDNRHFARFARNIVYWATENSAVGRRRLVPTANKRFYRPGETVAISAQAFDETATRTGRYRVVASIEPKQIEGAEPPCPVKWPAGKPRASGGTGALAQWGEEINLQFDPQAKDYLLGLPLIDALAANRAAQAFNLELTAFDGETQIDSSSIDVQILSDPQEQQNPLPNREFLAALAKATGGREFTDANALADAITQLPVAVSPPTIRQTPLWNYGTILYGILAIMGMEWVCRRWLGLA